MKQQIVTFQRQLRCRDLQIKQLRKRIDKLKEVTDNTSTIQRENEILHSK